MIKKINKLIMMIHLKVNKLINDDQKIHFFLLILKGKKLIMVITSDS